MSASARAKAARKAQEQLGDRLIQVRLDETILNQLEALKTWRSQNTRDAIALAIMEAYGRLRSARASAKPSSENPPA